jgi:sugar phosphate isomerase/epimerase
MPVHTPNRIGIEAISVFGLPPVQFVNLAADLGCHYISTGLIQGPPSALGYPGWSLRDDPALRKEMIVVMRDRDVSISLGEGFTIRPGVDVRDKARDLELMCELGVKRINAVSMEPDLQRTYDQFAAMAEMADNVGVEANVELSPGLTIGNLTAAVAVVRHVARKNFKLLIDTMHFARSGSSVSDLAALDPDMIGYAQLCDAPRVSIHATYMEEAMSARMSPGRGELPLLDIVAALPAHVVLGLEIPQLALAQAGMKSHARLGQCVADAQALLQRIAAGVKQQ